MSSSVLSWIRSDETAKDALRAVTERPLLVLPPPLQGLPIRPGNVLEIVGPSSSAKTLILTQAAVSCILPKTWKGVQYGGLDLPVLFIDLDCRFQVSSLSRALRLRILGANRNKMEKGVNDCDNELFANCMKRFSYTRCYNSFQFLATLKTLQDLLKNEKENQGGPEYMVILDSIGAFYWVDHALAVPTSLTYSNSRKISLQSVAETVVQEIKKLQLLHSIVVLASRSSALGDKPSSIRRNSEGQVDSRGTSNLWQYDRVPLVWKSLVSLRVLVHPSGTALGGSRKDQHNPTFTTEWLLPPVDFSGRFTISDDGSLVLV